MDFVSEIFYNGAKSGNGMVVIVHCDKYDSPIGPIWLTGRDGILTGLSFVKPIGQFSVGNFKTVEQWLNDYFQGVSREIDFQTELSGTTFQKLIWDMLLEIPFGQTITYGQLAKRAARAMGKEKMSSQAVGQAVSRNPIAIIIPCHRVMGAGGKLTGYAYGIEKKLWLLNHEGSRR